jgi:hypothetical protein
VDWARADRDYFDAVGVTILRGRNFDATDVADAPRVTIVSAAAAASFWPGEDPIGRSMRQASTEYRVIGVASNTKVRSLGEAPRPFMYLPLSQSYSSYPTLVARTKGTAEHTAAAMLSVLREVDPDLVIYESTTMEGHLSVTRFPMRLAAVVFTLFAALALVLATVGVYGIVSYTVSRRTREVGIRLALGAGRCAVVRTLVGHGLRIGLLGTAVGITLALFATRTLSRFLFAVGSRDPVIFVAVPVLLIVVAVVAAFIPAHRASGTDPVRAMRSD